MNDFLGKEQLGQAGKIFFNFAEKYQLLNPKFLGKSRYLKIQKILFSLLTISLFLLAAQLFGFSFGFDWPILLSLFGLLFFILAIWEIRKRRSVIEPEVKRIVLEIEGRFLDKREEVQKKIIARTPKGLADNRNLISLTFAGVLVFFSWFWRSIALLGAVLGIVADIFIFESSSDLLILFLAILWLLSIKCYKFQGRISIGASLIFLTLCPFLLIIKKESIAEKAAVWAYLLMAVGIIQMFVEYLKESRKESNRTAIG